MSEQVNLTGCGSEAQMFDSKPVMEETEAVVVAEGVGLSPTGTEIEAAEMKIHVQVEEAGKLVALPVSDIPDFAEQQAVSGHKDQTESHNVVAGAGGDVQNEELLKSGDNNYNDGELMMDCLEKIYVIEFVNNPNEVENDDELCGSPSAEVKVETQDGSDGVDNEQTATGEVGKNPSILVDNYVPETETEEEVGKNPNILVDNYVPETETEEELGKSPNILVDNYVPETETEEGVGKNPNILIENYVPGIETKEEQAAFLKEVEAFYKENQLEFRQPKFYKEGLNLLKLWKVVKYLGGYKQVTSYKLWKKVGDLFNPPK